MSYPELAQHAARVQQLAVHESLKQKAWIDVGHGELLPPPGYDDQGARNLVALVERQFSGAAQMFSPFLTLPDPEGFGPMIKYLTSAMTSLSSGEGSVDPVNRLKIPANEALKGISTVSNSLHDWRGFAAVAFKQNFLEPFPAIIVNQFALVATLKGAIEAEQALWRECRANVDDIAHKAIRALEVMEECSPDEQVCLLTVATSIFAVGAAFTTGGVSIGLTVAGAATQALSGAPRADAPTVQFDGQTPQAILAQVQDALNRLAEVTNATERRIADAMRASAATLAADRSSYVSPRPALAGATAATITSTAGMGVVI